MIQKFTIRLILCLIMVISLYVDALGAERKLPYFILGPTIALRDKVDREAVLQNLKTYGANACLGFGLPKNGPNLIALLRKKGILVCEDAHNSKIADLKRIQNLEVPYCMAGEYNRLWLMGLENYLKENDVDIYSLTLDEEYWNDLFLGWAFGTKAWEDLPAYSFSEEFIKGFDAYCEPFNKEFSTKLKLPNTGRTRILCENTVATRKFITYRYEVYAKALKERADQIKKWKPEAFTYTVFSAVPIFALERYPSGIAWEIVGRIARPDFMCATAFQTFQDYRGHDTHRYLTESACHLEASNRPRPAGIVMAVHHQNINGVKHCVEWPVSSPLFYEPVRIRPVDVIGQAVSYAAHGLRGILCYDPGPPDKDPGLWLKQAYSLLKEVGPVVEKSHTPKAIAFLHSRLSEDFYSLYYNSKRHLNADGDGSAAMWRARGWAQPANRIAHDYNLDNEGSKGFRAQKKLLHFLIREGIPFDFFFLEDVSENDLEPYKAVLVPFPFSISEKKTTMFENLRKRGKSFIIFSEYGQTDEEGTRQDRGTGGGLLLKFLGLKKQPPELLLRQTVRFTNKSPFLPGSIWKDLNVLSFFPAKALDSAWPLATGNHDGPAVLLREKKDEGSVIYLGGEFALRASDMGYCDINLAAIDFALGKARPLTVSQPPGADVEVALREISESEKLIFLINWDDVTRSIRVGLPVPKGRYIGTVFHPNVKSKKFSMRGNGQFSEEELSAMSFKLAAGEVKIIHLRPLKDEG